jgi:aryl-alcohol dehydrogenase-like predicted oxidoreductase
MQLAIGTANFGNRYGINKILLSEKEISRILLTAKKLKIKYLDTAFNYGESLNLLSKFNLKYFKISSKITIKKEDNKFILLSIKKKIDNLKIHNFHEIMIHNFYEMNKEDIKRFIPLMLSIKEQKLAKKIGISIYDSSELEKTWDIWKPDIIQLPLNIFDRRFLNNKWIKKLYNNNIEVHVRSIFLQGLLLKNCNSVFSCAKNITNEFSKWSIKKNISKIEACINFIKNCKKIDRVIFGIENNKQLLELNKIFHNKKDIFPKNIFSNNLNIIDPRLW